jgi:hypothetical protein
MSPLGSPLGLAPPESQAACFAFSVFSLLQSTAADPQELNLVQIVPMVTRLGPVLGVTWDHMWDQK